MKSAVGHSDSKRVVKDPSRVSRQPRWPWPPHHRRACHQGRQV